MSSLTTFLGEIILNLEWNSPIHYESGGNFTWPKSEGVYVIAKEIDGKIKAKYVGQGNLYERMTAHEGKDEQNTCLKKVMDDRDNVKVYYAKVTNQVDRENAEYTLFQLYGGTDKLCNQIAPVGQLDYEIKGPFIDAIDF